MREGVFTPRLLPADSAPTVAGMGSGAAVQAWLNLSVPGGENHLILYHSNSHPPMPSLLGPTLTHSLALSATCSL